jgi:hypothetical protein
MNKIVIFGAGEVGFAAYKHYGDSQIIAFADNYKTGTFCGLPIWNLDELARKQEEVRIVVASALYAKEIVLSLKAAGIEDFEVFQKTDRYNNKCDPALLSSFRDIHKGERCFIIGTGPSLRLADLETLHAHHELCIGTNKVFLAFDQISWRPDYYLIIDSRQIDQYGNDLAALPLPHKFVAIRNIPFWASHLCEGCIGVRINDELYTASMPSFSNDLSSGLFEGCTVTYAAMQLAAHMGFSEIYLLGVDFDYSGNTTKGENHFIKNYMRKGEVFLQTDESRALLAYQKAELFSREHGFRIYNATRGGKLEVFERVNFDNCCKTDKASNGSI